MFQYSRHEETVSRSVGELTLIGKMHPFVLWWGATEGHCCAATAMGSFFG
jgi:hypothetical protein